jgi:Ser/Thr protein kinase RdoA (MazF antagonist)
LRFVKTTVTTLEAAAKALGVRSLDAIGSPLPTSSRNEVLHARTPDGGTVIVKRYLVPEPVAAGREPSALSALRTAGSECVPGLLAEGPDLLVLSDLGAHGNVADALLGNEPDDAAEALRAWGRGLGRFHVDGRAAKAEFEHQMTRRTGQCTDYMTTELTEAVTEWERLATTLGVAVPSGAFSALGEVTTRFKTTLEVLSAGDMCPDNNLVIDGRVVMIDLECATIRHLAWDVAYLRVPWPSCWCAWTLPTVVADAATAAWRDQVSPALDGIQPTDLEDDLGLATDAWRWLSACWLMQALERPARPTLTDRPSPRHQDRIVHSLRAVSSSPHLPDLRELATHLADAVATRYDATPLGFPPAFTAPIPGA